MATFVLVHSPLVGPMTWKLVAEELQRRSVGVIVPTLSTDPSTKPYWKQHTQKVVTALEATPTTERLILIAHSGAGVLLPAIRQMMSRPVAGYIYVDAGLPKNGASRLDLFGLPEERQQFRESAQNGLLPTWSDDDLREAITDDDLRREFVAELRPLPVAVYEEPIPVFDGWHNAPCAYLLFSETYREFATFAENQGWPHAELMGGHFHMLNHPVEVAETLLDLAKKMNT